MNKNCHFSTWSPEKGIVSPLDMQVHVEWYPEHAVYSIRLLNLESAYAGKETQHFLATCVSQHLDTDLKNERLS
jgi:hypothetical protein